MIAWQGPWLRVPFDDLGHWLGGSTPSKKVAAYWTNGHVPWVSPKDFGPQTIDESVDQITQLAVDEGGATIIPEDSLLIVTRSSILKHSLPTAVNGRSVAINQDVKALVPAPGINARFLQYQMDSAVGDILQATVKSGTTVESVDFRTLRQFPLIIAPSAEQDRIVAILDKVMYRLDDCTALIRATGANIDILKAHILKSAFDGELTSGWRERNDVDAKWPRVRISDVTSKISYGSARKSRPTGDVAVLRMGNIQDGRIVWDDLVYSSDAGEISRHRLQDGDVLFNRTNSPELVGKTAVFRSEQPAIAAGYLIVVKCDPRIEPDVLAYFLNSPAGRAYCWSVKSDGVSQSNINAQKLAAFEFGLPPIDEQREICRKVSVVFNQLDVVRHELADTITALNLLKDSILKMVFQTTGNARDINGEITGLLDRAKIFKAGPKRPATRRKKSMPDRPPLREVIEARLLSSVPDGVTFEDLRATLEADYETLKLEIFSLLSQDPPRVRQVFDKKERVIRLMAVGQ
jgi:type I restriction enzyme S subunit